MSLSSTVARETAVEATLEAGQNGTSNNASNGAAPHNADTLPRLPKSVQVGGQALIEGVMMRSPNYVAAAVRRKDGSIHTTLEPVQSVMKQYPVLGLPFVRGVVGLFEMLTLGMRFLNWSSNIALEDEAAPSKNHE